MRKTKQISHHKIMENAVRNLHWGVTEYREESQKIKNNHTDQWNRRESSETSLHLHGQLIYNKGGKTIKMKKVSSRNGVAKTRQLHAKEKKRKDKQ